MFVLPDVLSSSACGRLRAAIDRSALSPAAILVDDYHVDMAVRQTMEADVDAGTIAEVEAILATVRPRVASFFAVPLAGAEGPGFLRYLPGGFYAPHRDILETDGETFPRRISIVLFLTTSSTADRDGTCDGGALRLYGLDEADGSGVVDIAPVAGTLVAFPSSRLHEVLPVQSGIRDAIVDWFY